MSQSIVILDSSALIAQININDLWHKKADAIADVIARTDRHVILPAEVFAERSSVAERYNSFIRAVSV